MEKRYYDMKLTGPFDLVGATGQAGSAYWIVETKTRFDLKTGDEIPIDISGHFSAISNRTITPVKTWFKHKDRKSKGDPKRNFVSFTYRWECVIGKESADQGFSAETSIEIYTKTRSRPDAQAINAVSSYAKDLLPANRVGLTYRLRGPEEDTPLKIRYSERVDGFQSLWHFNIGHFITHIHVEGVRR